MSTEANFDNRGGRDSSTPSSPLPSDILEILEQQKARMDELLEQERARSRRELAEKLKAASKAQEGRIYKEIRRKVIDEELPRIRFLLKEQLTPLVMGELRAENARAALGQEKEDRGRTRSHHLDSRDARSRSPERAERQHRRRSPCRRQVRLEQQTFEENTKLWDYQRRRPVNNEDSETKQAILPPSEKQHHPRGLRRSSSEAHLDDEEQSHLIAIHGSKRFRTGPGPISMRRSPSISFQSYSEYHFPSRSPRRNITRSHSRRQLSPLSRSTQAYLRTERAIPSIENDGPLLTEEQLKEAGRFLGYYTRSPDEVQGEGFTPSNSDNLPRENPGVDRSLTPLIRPNGVGSGEDSLPDKFTPASANSSAGFVVQGQPLHGTPPLCQPQEAENTVGPVGRLPHGWFLSRTDILQKTRDLFPHKYWGLSSEFRPLLVFYDQRHILIESEGLYFFWHEPTNSLERIHRPKGLQEILKQLDHGTLLPRKASIPAELNAPLIIMELIRAENLLYWSTREVIHRRRSSIDRAVRQGLIRLGSESSIHDSNANEFKERDEEDGDNPDALFGRYSDGAQGALDGRDSREPGYDASNEDNTFEEGTTLNNPIDLTSSPPTLQGHPAYDCYTSSNSDSHFFRRGVYERHWGDFQGASRHREFKELLEEEFDDQEILDRYYDWAMDHEDSVDARAIKEQLRFDEEQYP